MLVGALILGINFAAVPNETVLVVSLFVVSAAALVAFYIRQRRAANPLYDLDAAARPTFWVAGVAGLIVFGSLMGAMFIGQQFLQNVLGYSTVEAGAAILPAAVFMVLVAPRSAKLVERNGARQTLLSGYVFVMLGFLTMLLLWKEDIAYWKVALGYSFVGIGVGLAGTPASHSLTSSVPVKRVGMASGTADLQRDLGGAIMQSIFGALLTAGYAAAAGAAIAASGKNVNDQVQTELTKSFASAADTAARYPASVQDQIIAAAKTSFLQGDQWAYLAGVIAVLLGATLVFFKFPKRDEEKRLLAAYHAADTAVPQAEVFRRGPEASRFPVRSDCAARHSQARRPPTSSTSSRGDRMTDRDPRAKTEKASLVERRVQRIAGARSVTIGLAGTFVVLALVGAVAMRIADPDNFPNLGLAIWWALQTVTTVGYGDVVPTTDIGRVVGGIEMVLGVSFIAFLTAGVTSTVIQRREAGTAEDERAQREREVQTILDALAETRQAIKGLDERLARIESRPGG